MRRPKYIQRSELPLTEVGRSMDGRPVYVLNQGTANSDVMLSIKYSTLRYQVDIELQGGQVIDSGYVDRGG